MFLSTNCLIFMSFLPISMILFGIGTVSELGLGRSWAAASGHSGFSLWPAISSKLSSDIVARARGYVYRSSGSMVSRRLYSSRFSWVYLGCCRSRSRSNAYVAVNWSSGNTMRSQMDFRVNLLSSPCGVYFVSCYLMIVISA